MPNVTRPGRSIPKLPTTHPSKPAKQEKVPAKQEKAPKKPANPNKGMGRVRKPPKPVE